MENQPTYCADSAFYVTACCFGRRRCFSAARSGWSSRCRSACCASPVSGGLDRMEFLDNRQFNGNAFTLLANAERFLRDTLPIAGRFEQDRFERIDEPLYPPLATREALANALCHRDYSIGGGSVGIAIYDDRLEVTSSGSLHFGLTPEKLFGPHESRPWNPLIARTFYRRGIIEEWGSGTLKIAELTNSAGLPAPEIEDDGGAVTVRFRHGRFVPRPTTSGVSGPEERRKTILALLEGVEDGLTRQELHARLGPEVSERQVRRALSELKNGGLVVSTNRGPLTRWKEGGAIGGRYESDRGAIAVRWSPGEGSQGSE